MSSGFFDSEIHDLMLRHVEGATSPAEARRLEFVLRSSPKAQREYAELLLQVVQLRAIGQEENEGAFETGIVKPAAASRRRLVRTGWTALAASFLLLGLLAWLFVTRWNHGEGDVAFDGIPDATASSNGVAVLTRGAGVVWQRDVSAILDRGVALSPGRLRLEEGVVQLRFNSGVEMILEGPAELRLISAQETALRFGRLSAHVPPEARGFVVRSDRTKITDLGTDFAVSRRSAGSPLELHVFSGRVEFASTGDQKAAVELTTGQAVEIRRKDVRTINANRLAFVSRDQLKHREFTETHERIQAWRQTSESLGHDPAALLHLTFDGQDETNRRLINRALAGRTLGGEIYGCDWSEGRWPSKRALEFSRPGAKVHFVVPGQFHSLTYLAWVRVESLPNVFNGLSLSERRIPGAVHWQLVNEGGVEFSVKAPGSRPDGLRTGWDRLLSRPVIEPEMLGQWVHLAAVYDGAKGRMSVYVNGQLVQWKSAKPVPLTVGDIGLGNWHPMDLSPVWQALGRDHPDYQLYVVRNFRGRMDEFTILARPMSAEEIQHQYQIGKPNSSTHTRQLESREGSNLLKVEEADLPDDELAG